MAMASSDEPLRIIFEIIFNETWRPEVGDDSEEAASFRLYNDDTWEFLDKNGLPIFQGLHAKVTVSEGKPK
jgi:hypothetical protein